MKEETKHDQQAQRRIKKFWRSPKNLIEILAVGATNFGGWSQNFGGSTLNFGGWTWNFGGWGRVAIVPQIAVFRELWIYGGSKKKLAVRKKNGG